MTSVLGYARTFFVGGRYRPGPLPSFHDEITRFQQMLEDLSQQRETGTPRGDATPDGWLPPAKSR